MRNLEISENECFLLKHIFIAFDKYKNEEEIFYDLCFFICSPQTCFKNVLKLVAMLRTMDFYNLALEDYIMEFILKEAGIFSPKSKAKRLLSAKKDFDLVLKILEMKKGDQELRDLLVKFIDGLGMKTASHFLRNLGCRNLVIIDNSILKFLKCERPTSNKNYKEIEKKFIEIAYVNSISPAKANAVIRLREDWTQIFY